MTTIAINPAAVIQPPVCKQAPPRRIAIICDYAEENWPSMDLVGNMLRRSLVDLHSDGYNATLVRPTLPFSTNSHPHAFTRILGRFVHYPRELRRIQSR